MKLLAEVKQGERIIITHRGKPAAAVIDFERLQLLTELACLWQDPQSLSHIRAAHEDLRAGRVHPLKGVPTITRLVELARQKGFNQSEWLNLHSRKLFCGALLKSKKMLRRRSWSSSKEP